MNIQTLDTTIKFICQLQATTLKWNLQWSYPIVNTHNVLSKDAISHISDLKCDVIELTWLNQNKLLSVTIYESIYCVKVWGDYIHLGINQRNKMETLYLNLDDDYFKLVEWIFPLRDVNNNKKYRWNTPTQ